MLEFGNILITLLIGVVIYSLLAFVSRKGGGCCGNTDSHQKGSGKKPSCCNDHKV
jgi:hypothetical protein